MYYSYALLGPCTRPRRKTDEMSTDISVAGHAMTPAMKAIPTHERNGSGNGAPFFRQAQGFVRIAKPTLQYCSKSQGIREAVAMVKTSRQHNRRFALRASGLP